MAKVVLIRRTYSAGIERLVEPPEGGQAVTKIAVGSPASASAKNRGSGVESPAAAKAVAIRKLFAAFERPRARSQRAPTNCRPV